ncbi:hypothetical protein [Actinomadura coerulea]|uniref:hypothetical protein n=1 Tax=Actinomadura coerulea TaxID=46159 RepID=UPI003432F385
MTSYEASGSTDASGAAFAQIALFLQGGRLTRTVAELEHALTTADAEQAGRAAAAAGMTSPLLEAALLVRRDLGRLGLDKVGLMPVVSQVLCRCAELGRPGKKEARVVPRTPEDFGRAFTALLAAAGMSPDRLLRKRPGVAGRSTLYSWKGGRNLPEDTAPLLAVVEVCLELAADADLGEAPVDIDGWAALVAEAKQTRDSRTAQHRTIPPGGGPSGPGAGAADGGSSGPGRFISRWDPVVLGVHRAIGGQVLPWYVRRAHDDVLYALLDPAPAASRLVVLRGGSSTGKTRAAYQAVHDRFPHWPVLYPRTAAALTKLLEQGVPARSVLWLNELRDYADDPAGSDALFALADLLTGRDRIVAITTVWPSFWKTYTTDPRGGQPGAADPTRAVRHLVVALPDLTGHSPADVDAAGGGGVLDVAAQFTDQDLHAAHRSGDRTLNAAIIAARRAGAAGRITQYLAGVFDLLEHVQGVGADPLGQALIFAAMDATGMGCSSPLPLTLLEQAAVGYLPSQHRAVTQQRWSGRLAEGWEYATRQLKGAVRALEPVPPGDHIGVAGYRLADYLDQDARTTRADQLPPIGFWTAAAAQAPPTDQTTLGNAAWCCGLYRHAAQLWKNATTHGDPHAAHRLVDTVSALHPTDYRPATHAAAHAAVDHPYAVAELFVKLRQVGAQQQPGALAERAAAHAALDQPDNITYLIRRLRDIGTQQQMAALLVYDPAAQVSLGDARRRLSAA